MPFGSVSFGFATRGCRAGVSSGTPKGSTEQVSLEFCCKGTQGRNGSSQPCQKEIPGVIWGFSDNLPGSAQVHGRAVCEGKTGLRPPARPGGRLRIPHDTIP